jgi:hypothetical protein
MTRFAFEVPHFNLEDFEDLQDFHFILSLHWDNIRCRKFYLKQAKVRRKAIWLDNSFNETGVADVPQALVKVANELKADKVIVPDDLSWGLEEAIAPYKEISKLWPVDKAVVVVNTQEMLEVFKREGALHFAIPYRTRLSAYKEWLTPQDLSWTSRCHFLGLCSVRELEVIRPLTCDTSMPIKLALIGKTLKEWEEEGCPHIHTKDDLSFFDKRLMGVQLRLARSNIKQLKERCL